MTTNYNKTAFAPQLFIPNGTTNISFYYEAFGAVEVMQRQNEYGSIHVSELSIKETIFHLHEECPEKDQLTPGKANGVTTLVGLFVEDVDAMINSAVQAGATL